VVFADGSAIFATLVLREGEPDYDVCVTRP
jgi:hypothetical protein